MGGDLLIGTFLENIDDSHEGNIDQIELVSLDVMSEGVLDQTLDDLVGISLDSIIPHGFHILGEENEEPTEMLGDIVG